MFSDPYAKFCFVARLVSQFERVTYIDLDTTFTAYFNTGLVQANRVEIYLPSEGRLEPMIMDALESMGNSSLVVLDSVNSFYNLFGARERMGGLNHLLSVLLMLLVRRGVDEKIPVLATSMLRYRKDGGWVQSPASRRLLQSKSAARLRVERVEGDLAVTVVEHESMPAGTQLVYRDSLITV
jgi:RecA/RadA recombinase